MSQEMRAMSQQSEGGEEYAVPEFDAKAFTVLIPAAAPSADLPGSVRSSALTPMAGRPVVQWTVEYLLKLGFKRFVIAVAPGSSVVEDFVQTLFGADADISFLEVDTATVGDTVVELAEACSTVRALVVLGDTFFRFANLSKLMSDTPLVLTAAVDDSYRWCIARTSAGGEVTELVDKEPALPGPLNALIGVYQLPSVERFLDVVGASAVSSANKGEGQSLTIILEQLMGSVGLLAQPAGDWFDAGNPDRRSAASRSLLAHRAFNSLAVDDLSGTITKRSTDVGKFINEINYLRLLPPDLAVLFPRIVDYSVANDNPWVTMEFYGYPTLTELFLYHGLDASVWRRIFEHVSDILWQRMAVRTHAVERDSVKEMFIGKVRNRIEPLSKLEGLSSLVQADELVVNGVELANLPMMWERLESEVAVMAANPVGSVIHGDLCLSNVLYDLRSSVCRFIDPRGSFGQVGIGGDLRYDAAKLWHSLHGWYDLITADLFSVEITGPVSVNLDVRVRPDHLFIRDAFADVFFKRFDRQQITLIAGLIMCSIAALHYDHSDRQIAMYVRGIELLNEVLEDGK